RGLAEEGLGQRQQEARPERGPVARADRGGRPAPDSLAMGQGPRRARRKRTRRCARLRRCGGCWTLTVGDQAVVSTTSASGPFLRIDSIAFFALALEL